MFSIPIFDPEIVTIQEARETSQSATEQQFKQSSISIGISNPLEPTTRSPTLPQLGVCTVALE